MREVKFNITEWLEHDWKQGEHVWAVLYNDKSTGWAPEAVVEAVILSVNHRDAGSEYEFIEITAKPVNNKVKGCIHRTSGYLKDADPVYGGEPWSIYVFLNKEDALWKAEQSRKRGIEEYKEEKKYIERKKKELQRKINKLGKEINEIDKRIEHFTKLKYE